jgi:hypothetical protein
MAEEIRILVPKQVAEIIKRAAERKRLTVEQLILRALVKIIEEEKGA